MVGESKVQSTIAAHHHHHNSHNHHYHHHNLHCGHHHAVVPTNGKLQDPTLRAWRGGASSALPFSSHNNHHNNHNCNMTPPPPPAPPSSWLGHRPFAAATTAMGNSSSCSCGSHSSRMIDPYQVLQVRRDATHAEIRQAYRRLALWHHPGRCMGVAAPTATTTGNEENDQDDASCAKGVSEEDPMTLERHRRWHVFNVLAASYETLMDQDARWKCDLLLKQADPTSLLNQQQRASPLFPPPLRTSTRTPSPSSSSNSVDSNHHHHHKAVGAGAAGSSTFAGSTSAGARRGRSWLGRTTTPPPTVAWRDNNNNNLQLGSSPQKESALTLGVHLEQQEEEEEEEEEEDDENDENESTANNRPYTMKTAESGEGMIGDMTVLTTMTLTSTNEMPPDPAQASSGSSSPSNTSLEEDMEHAAKNSHDSKERQMERETSDLPEDIAPCNNDTQHSRPLQLEEQADAATTTVQTEENSTPILGGLDGLCHVCGWGSTIVEDIDLPPKEEEEEEEEEPKMESILSSRHQESGAGSTGRWQEHQWPSFAMDDVSTTSTATTGLHHHGAASQDSMDIHYTQRETNRLFEGPLQLMYRARRWKPFTDPFVVFARVFECQPESMGAPPPPPLLQHNDSNVPLLMQEQKPTGTLTEATTAATTTAGRKRTWAGSAAPSSSWRVGFNEKVRSNVMNDGTIVYTTRRLLEGRIMTRTETVYVHPKTGQKRSVVKVTSEALENGGDDNPGVEMKKSKSASPLTLPLMDILLGLNNNNNKNQRGSRRGAAAVTTSIAGEDNKGSDDDPSSSNTKSSSSFPLIGGFDLDECLLFLCRQQHYEKKKQQTQCATPCGEDDENGTDDDDNTFEDYDRMIRFDENNQICTVRSTTPGYSDSSNQGYSDGRSSATIQGYSDGRSTATPQGYSDGTSTGTPPELSDGRSTATPPELSDGQSTGTPGYSFGRSLTATPPECSDGRSTATLGYSDGRTCTPELSGEDNDDHHDDEANPWSFAEACQNWLPSCT